MAAGSHQNEVESFVLKEKLKYKSQLLGYKTKDLLIFTDPDVMVS